MWYTHSFYKKPIYNKHKYIQIRSMRPINFNCASNSTRYIYKYQNNIDDYNAYALNLYVDIFKLYSYPHSFILAGPLCPAGLFCPSFPYLSEKWWWGETGYSGNVFFSHKYNLEIYQNRRKKPCSWYLWRWSFPVYRIWNKTPMV